MQQLDQFVCIEYPQIDFLIPQKDVLSCVGVKDVETSLLQNQHSGIVDFDEIAKKFNQSPRESDIKTMIVLKGEEKQLSVITTQECRVFTMNYKDFGLFSDLYSKGFEHFGIFACSFDSSRMRLLINAKQTIKFMNNYLLEEL